MNKKEAAVQVMKFILPDEGAVLELLQPQLKQRLNPSRTPEWVTNKKVMADQPVPVMTKQSGGVYRRFLRVRGLPKADQIPQFNTVVDIYNQQRGILPLAGFEFDYLSREPNAALTSARPAGGNRMFLVAGVYDTKPGSNEPCDFYPQLVRAGAGLQHTSSWEPLFIEAHQAYRWLEPWNNAPVELQGREFEYFKFAKEQRAA